MNKPSCAKCSNPKLKLKKKCAYFLCVDIEMEKSCSGFDLVMVLISKQSFSQHCVWPVWKGKSILNGIALPNLYMVCSFFSKKLKEARVITIVYLFCDDATTCERSQM